MPSILSKVLRGSLLHSGNKASPGDSEGSTVDRSQPAQDPSLHTTDSSDTSSISSSGSAANDQVPHASLYKDAEAYEQVLKKTGCLDSDSCCRHDEREHCGFDHLIRKDLTSEEKVLVSHDARFRAMMNPPKWFDDPSSTSQSTSPTSSIPHEPQIRRPPGCEEQLSGLSAGEVVDILITEFGPLAHPGEEKLLLEVDGCIVIDVSVIGVIHLTTHRLTFHASLLASNPEVGQSILKNGPATYHRSGWHSKRRIWLELDNRMLCAYTSSRDADRVRPLCTVLLSSIKEIMPVDRKHPRTMRIIRTTTKSHAHDYLEFDTLESSNQWRQEIQGALFLSRYEQKHLYDTGDPDQPRGITISVPLLRIQSLERRVMADFPNIVAVKISPGSDSNTMVQQCGEIQRLRIGPIAPVSMWNNLEGVICDAKYRASANNQNLAFELPIFVDFGPLSFFKRSAENDTDETVQNSTVKRVLGFEQDEPTWIVPARNYGSFSPGGYFVVSDTHVGFWSKNLAKRDIKYRFPGTHILDVQVSRSNQLFSLHAVSLILRDKKELKLIFRSSAFRDEAISRIKSVIALGCERRSSALSTTSTVVQPISTPTDSATSLAPGHNGEPVPKSPNIAINILSPMARTVNAAAHAREELSQDVRNRLPKAINLPTQALLSAKHFHFVCLTIGSRGDVQPYIALGIGLLKEGHRVTIVTHEEYREWIHEYGLGHRTAGGDPGQLMKLSVENKIMSPEFFKKSLSKFRPWLDQLLKDSWDACQDADVLNESPSAMAGVHISEALAIPYFRSFSMPWTKTTEFPHPFLSPPVESPAFNSGSYILFSNVMWAATSSQINRWRQKTLHLPRTDMGHLAQAKIIFIYFFSQSVVPKPLDWPDTVSLSGYWFLKDSDPGWEAPQGLIDWMAQARADGKPIVYIGFGSVTVPHPNKMLNRLISGVQKSGVRAIISRGWSHRMDSSGGDVMPVIPPECFLLEKVPHDWLFTSIDAAMHHGGAGTTAASIRAGIPTLIKPWFGDQFFWASRVERLGIGLKVNSLKTSVLSAALIRATTDIDVRERAMLIGEKIRSEDGVHNAIYTIYTYLHHASQDRKSLDLAKI
ncbi:sterol 3-beta-glucosyltransferase [Coprinopsis cinerea okayama7|uniref:sterol 3beta-glucosyltransferase n=1 Tax=Coprinopsis cinerea (strain Okayama-7 / 130 / ATCC MYA-4618 / FGSC 9003) TaxID=240176 RepID=A8NQR1_COPC7|nr:sterol 3-beta-glucosyltransferase [Coprinopsis cinerea okayama7\|eukprot:XP_001835658.2 sterol 3-beta-glucosyltransferase [Coprinopsis cinerea okayama7\